MFNNGFYCATLCIRAVFAVARCLSVRLSRWCIYILTAEDIVKLVSPPGSPVTLVFDLGADTQFQGEPLQWGAKYTGWEKLAIFDRNRRLSRIRPWLLLNTYRKSYALYRTMSFSMTSTDPYSCFQGHGIFYVKYLKKIFDP